MALTEMTNTSPAEMFRASLIEALTLQQKNLSLPGPHPGDKRLCLPPAILEALSRDQYLRDSIPTGYIFDNRPDDPKQDPPRVGLARRLIELLSPPAQNPSENARRFLLFKAAKRLQFALNALTKADDALLSLLMGNRPDPESETAWPHLSTRTIILAEIGEGLITKEEAIRALEATGRETSSLAPIPPKSPPADLSEQAERLGASI